MQKNTSIPRSSKNTVYKQLLDETYINGKYYIGEKSIKNKILQTITRNITEPYYLIEAENRHSIGFKLLNFKNTQKINITITTTDTEYTYTTGIYKNNYIYAVLDEEINPENITNINIRANENLENHIKYTGINRNITVNELTTVSKTEYNNIIRT